MILISYLALKITSPHLIDLWVSRKYFTAMNILTGAKDIMPLAFYQGAIEDLLFGPLKAILSGIILLMIGSRYLKNASFFIFSLFIFIFLLLTKYDILSFPPYGDSLVGPFSDAIWLIRHKLNYLHLMKQDSYVKGGPLVYPTSLYPLFLATVMNLINNPKIFLITIHTLTFGFAAITTATFRKMLSRVFADDTAALYGSILLVSLPLFQSMTELINLEMPCLLFGILSLSYLMERRTGFASFFAILSLLVKTSGAIFCTTVLWGGILLFFIDRNNAHRLKHLFWGIFTFLIAAGLGIVRNRIVGKQIEYNKLEFLIGWTKIKGIPEFWMMYVLILILLLAALIWVRKQGSNDRTIGHVIQTHFPVIILLSSAVIWFLFYINFSVMIARYTLILIPSLLFLLIYSIQIFIKDSKTLKILLTILILISGLFSYSLFIPKMDSNSSYRVNLLERSLEYRNDLKLHMMLAKEIEDNYSDQTICAVLFLAQALDFREVGYVTKPLDIMVYGMPGTHEGMREFPGIRKIDIDRTIWIGDHHDQIVPEIEYPISKERDIIIKEIPYGKNTFVLFKGGFAVEKMRLIFQLYRRDLLRKLHSSDPGLSEGLKTL